MGHLCVLPHLNRGEWASIEFSADEWELLEGTLKRPLSESLRQSMGEAVNYFIHSLRLKDNIPTPRQYFGQLRARIAEIIETADNLHNQITPIGGRPTEVDSLSPNAARNLLGGRETSWKMAARAARSTHEADAVLAVEDHVRGLIATGFPKQLIAAREALLNLLLSLESMQSEIASIPHNKAGADGNYELNLLLVDLLRIAKDAGDDLRLAPHDIRDEVMGKSVKPNPAFQFVEKIVELILGSTETLAAALKISDKDRVKLIERVKLELVRKPGTLIDPLEAARAIIEGGGRRE